MWLLHKNQSIHLQCKENHLIGFYKWNENTNTGLMYYLMKADCHSIVKPSNFDWSICPWLICHHRRSQRELLAEITDLWRPELVWGMKFADWGLSKIYLLLWTKEIPNPVGEYMFRAYLKDTKWTSLYLILVSLLMNWWL